MSAQERGDISRAALSWIENNSSELVRWRRHLHQFPELSRKEHHTTRFVAECLSALPGVRIRQLDPTGLIVEIGPATGPIIGIRADIDALPINESTGASYQSTVASVSHACGHDVHTAIAIALVHVLASVDGLAVGVRVIFQPAEEVMPGGALDVIEQGGIDGLTKIVALHCEPKLEVGKIGVRIGSITSAADRLSIRLSGTGGHTARPQLAPDIVYALGLVATTLPALLSRRVDPLAGTVVVFGAVAAGVAANAIPQEGSLVGTVRTGSYETWRLLDPLVPNLVADILRPTGVTVNIDYVRGLPPVVNDQGAVALVAKAVRSFAPNAIVEAPQSSGGEDFAWYLESVPGVLVRLGTHSGSGSHKDLHRPDFNVDEAALAMGVRMMAATVAEFFVDSDEAL